MPRHFGTCWSELSGAFTLPLPLICLGRTYLHVCSLSLDRRVVPMMDGWMRGCTAGALHGFKDWTSHYTRVTDYCKYVFVPGAGSDVSE